MFAGMNLFPHLGHQSLVADGALNLSGPATLQWVGPLGLTRKKDEKGAMEAWDRWKPKKIRHTKKTFKWVCGHSQPVDSIDFHEWNTPWIVQ